MESSPLTLAHSHARTALNQTHSSNLTAASDEHALAAGEFSKAGTTTDDPEALRTLKLLEQHHNKLSQLLKFQSSRPSANTTTPAVVEATISTVENAPTTALTSPTPNVPSDKVRSSSPYKTLHQPPTLPLAHRASPRDLSSSIATNLASARGIPSPQLQRRGAPVSPTLSAQHAGGVLGLSTKVRPGDKQVDRVSSPVREGLQRGQPQNTTRPPPPPVVKAGTTTVALSNESPGQGLPNENPPAAGEDAFQKFYSTFENLISKLSGPLAFAGLPLDGGDVKPSPEPSNVASPKINTQPTRATAEPDLTRIYSKSALRAVREGNGHGHGHGWGVGGGESFYIVPSTGGTISYAGILSRAEQEAGLSAADAKDLGINLHDGDDGTGSAEDGSAEFVDARETPQPPSPVSLKRGRRQDQDRVPPGLSTKTMEELHLENKALKHLTDNLSKRLHMWEVNAQFSSLALQQSLRAAHRDRGGDAGSPTSSEAGGGVGGDAAAAARRDQREKAALAERVKELEDEVRRGKAETEKLARENEKLRDILGRYRERWEKLKQGARVRREGGGNGGGSSGTGTGTGTVAGSPSLDGKEDVEA